MWKAISAAAATAALIAATSLLLSLSPQVEASTPAASTKAVRGDASHCERQSWPYYETGCVRDLRRNAGRAQAVRLVSSDRRYLAVLAEPPLFQQPPNWLASLPNWDRSGEIFSPLAQ
jgi:hypothetical protein